MVVRKTGLERALGNLISNAAQYGHQVHVGLNIQCHHIEICVEDDGPGIPKSLHKQVFRPFGDKIRPVTAQRGVGLG